MEGFLHREKHYTIQLAPGRVEFWQVPDPNLIAPLSGHSYNSRAFHRYKDVTDAMADKLVSLLE